jgi:S1-C subfamily serine protease
LIKIGISLFNFDHRKKQKSAADSASSNLHALPADETCLEVHMLTKLHFRPGLAMVTLSLMLAILLQSAHAQSPETGGLSGRILPSLVQLSIQKQDGRTILANGFLTVKDGVLAAAWHSVRDVKGIVARFSNGEEYECTGVIDKDEKRNVALIRIKVFGRPMLKMNTAETALGSVVTVAAIKDSAFGLVSASVVAYGDANGIKVLRLEGDIPAGNSGSPVIDGQGNTIGILTETGADGKSIFLAYPTAYILALDATLPTQPWKPGSTASVSPDQAAAAAQPPSSGNESVDAGIASALIFAHEMYGRIYYLTQRIYSITKYTTYNNANLYGLQSEVDNAITQCSWLKPSDPLRAQLVQSAIQALAKLKTVLDYCVQCNLMNNASPRRHPDQAQDFATRAFSTLTSIPGQIALLTPDLRTLDKSSPQFTKSVPVEMRYFLGLAQRRSHYVLGVITNPRAPRVIYHSWSGLADEIGLRGGDIIDSAAGRALKAEDDIEDFTLLIEANAGKTIELIISRNGKPKVLQAKIPAKFPDKFIRTQNNSLWP